MYRIFAGVLALFLAGCANLFPTNTHQPAVLTPIKNTHRIITKWTAFSAQRVDKSLSSSFFPIYQDGFFYTARPTGVVAVIDVLTGKTHKKWVLPKIQLTTTPAIKQNILFAGTNDGTLIAWDTEHKKLLWKNSLSTLLLEPPLIVDQMVLTKTNDGHISAFDQKTGFIKWHNQHAAPGFMIRAHQSLSALDHSIFLLGMPVGYIYAIDPQTGFKLWQESITVPKGRTEFEGAVDVIHPPLLSGVLLYTSAYESSIVCFDLKTNRRQWSQNILTRQPMALTHSHLIVSAANSEIIALDRQNGAVIWRTLALLNREISGPVAIGDKIIVVDRFGLAHLIDPKTGEIIGRRDMGMGRLLSPPQSFGEGVLLQNHYGKLAYIVLGQ